MAAKPLVLIGFMATGKSTVGRILAAELGLRFIDLDAAVEKSAGLSVADIFRSQGEAGFRRLESQALSESLESPNTVIATGGGAACQEDNLAAMLAKGFVVALSAPPAQILARTGGASGRPLLDGASDPLAAAQELLAAREPFYDRAHLKVDTAGLEPEAVAKIIIEALRSSEFSPKPSESASANRG